VGDARWDIVDPVHESDTTSPPLAIGGRRTGTTKPGTHTDFADLYEKYLDAVYDSIARAKTGNGRWRLTRQIGNEIRDRGARDVLDCAAGTGFPGLNLIAMGSDYGIDTFHLTDGDPDMIRVLRRRSAALGVEVPLPDQVQWDSAGADAVKIVDPLVLLWSELGRIGRKPYDYVLCRGNSLAYADTWTGSHDIPSHETIVSYLRQIALKVRPGGYLHIDAPWEATLTERKHRSVASGAVSIWEQVESGDDHRYWSVDFKLPSETLRFGRYSSLLTIHDLATALDQMGFDETTPFTMAGERENFGVIIARRPNDRPLSSSPDESQR